ncbi:unnamed protein product [Coregonus sp. 'balchen']|nr:unnamed protein product [Coregonus sp. 'balchen']
MLRQCSQDPVYGSSPNARPTHSNHPASSQNVSPPRGHHSSSSQLRRVEPTARHHSSPMNEWNERWSGDRTDS